MTARDERVVGHVQAITVYPVKSMAGQALDHAHLGWHGLEGDRRLALLRQADTSGLPWASARETPRLLAYRAEFAGEDLRRSPIHVRDPQASVRTTDDPTLLADIEREVGEPVRWLRLWRGTFDAMPLSVITTASVASIEEIYDGPVDVARMRSNVVVAAIGPRRFPEERWEGRSLVFGEGADPARIRVNRKDGRCRIVDLDPVTGVKNAEIFAAIVRERRNRLGVYASTERCGTIRVGDAVRLR
jgi:uncharacterized protein YcbX